MGALTITLPDEAATDALGRSLARALGPGRPVLLSGPLGAGKSHLARAAIRALTHPGQEVPSPSFTLVQTYETAAGPLWHVDLYRLGDASEADELGLRDAFDEAITLTEWPERLDEAPASALRIALADRDPRTATLSWDDPSWDGPAREARLRAFLAIAGMEGPVRHLPADWSARRYARAGGAIAMDTSTEEAARSARIYERLRGAGLAAPAVLAGPDHGLLLTEDHGETSLAAHLEAHPEAETDLYLSCAEAILMAQRAEASDLPPFGPAEMAEAAAITEIPGDWTAPLARALRAVDAPPVLILRDFHAENVMVRPGTGTDRIGVIDTQDAMRGHPAYDLASLLWDARRDVSDEARAACAALWMERTGTAPEALDAQLAVLTAQRAIRILGRLDALAAGGRDMPGHIRTRVRGQLSGALGHPALAEARAAMRPPWEAAA